MWVLFERSIDFPLSQSPILSSAIVIKTDLLKTQKEPENPILSSFTDLTEKVSYHISFLDHHYYQITTPFQTSS